MNIQGTLTFEKTWNAYHLSLTDLEYKERRQEYLKQGIEKEPLPFKYLQIVSEGGSRSSKTWSILQLLLTEMITRFHIKIVAWRPTKVLCRDTVMQDFKKILINSPEVMKNMIENKQKASFTYKPTGSRIIFDGVDEIEKALGSEQTISYFNEVTEFNHEVYLQISQRTAERVLADYNPSKKFFLESYRNDKETIFLHSTFKDNFYCPVPVQRRLLSYEPWETGSYQVMNGRIFFKGKEISKHNQPPVNKKNFERKSINEYMWMVYGLGIGAEKPNKIYKNWTWIAKEDFFKIPQTSYFGLDFGSAVPTALVEVKYDSSVGCFYILPRMYEPLEDLENSVSTHFDLHYPDIKKNQSMIVGDSAKQKYIDSLINNGYNAYGAIKGSGSVNLGISQVQSSKIFCVYDEEIHLEYSEYSWMENRKGEKLDEPLKKNDHYMDAIRYIINYLAEYLQITF